MTLRDDICNNIPEVTCKNVDFLEKMADDYAIEFWEWRSTCLVKNIYQYTNKEALQIFKKEKGL
jgi:hypothetical protein